MLDFEFLRPGTLAEAIRMLDTGDDTMRPISGGTAMMLMMKTGVFEPSRLVDLTRIEPEHHAISGSPAAGIRIGGMASLSQVERDPLVATVAPVIPRAMKRLSNVRVRNVARVGGNLAHGDPHMDLPPILAALRAEVVTSGPHGQRRIPVEQLFAGYYETVLEQAELITAVDIPSQAGWQTIYRKTTVRTYDDWPTLSVAVALRLDGDQTAEARVMVSAATEKLTRVPDAEAVLVGAPATEAVFRRVAKVAAGVAVTFDDAQGSAAYKKVLIEVELRRTLLQTMEQVMQ